MIMDILGSMDSCPESLQRDYVNMWKLARAYGKSLRAGDNEDAKALKAKMMDEKTYPIPLHYKGMALTHVESLIKMDYHTCMTALKIFKFLRLRMEDSDPMERIIAPRAPAISEAPYERQDPPLGWMD